MRNRVLKTLTAISAFIFLVSASALDSESWIPFIAAIISGALLSIFYFANAERWS